MIGIIFIVLSYLFGSLLFCKYLPKLLLGIDVSKYGSKNPGARNTYRLFGKIGVFCGILDGLKGFIPVIIAFSLGEIYVYLCGFAAVLGHIFPVYHKFKGGIGQATTLGAILGLFVLQNKLNYEKYFIFIGLLYILISLIIANYLNKKKKVNYIIRNKR